MRTSATDAAGGSTSSLTIPGLFESEIFTLPHPALYNNSATNSTNQTRAYRVRISKTGTITDFLLGVAGTSSGNVDVGIYTFDGTTYNRAWSKGSTACPPATSWTSMGNPNVAVTRGQYVWLTFSADNSVATFYRAIGSSSVIAGLPATFLTGTLAWSKGAFPLPASATAASVTAIDVVNSLAIKVT